MSAALKESLRCGASHLKLSLKDVQLNALMIYIEQLVKWNKVYNLTAVRDPQAMVVRHLLDSLTLAPWCTARKYIDVGTGAGLPGVPLAILFPDKEFHLLDSNSKKTRFLIQVKAALGLHNLWVHHERVEHFVAQQSFDVVLSRAFASLGDMVRGCSHLLSREGQFFAMKGEVDTAEIESVADLVEIVGVHNLQVPGLSEQRHLIILSGLKNG